MHEAMCADGDSHLTLEFDDHFVIQPSIQFSHKADFTINGLGEVGRPVALGFDYNSRDNTIRLSAQQLLDKIKSTELEEK
jgi:UDP-N-acetylglucosamine 4,6-dehydratase